MDGLFIKKIDIEEEDNRDNRNEDYPKIKETMVSLEWLFDKEVDKESKNKEEKEEVAWSIAIGRQTEKESREIEKNIVFLIKSVSKDKMADQDQVREDIALECPSRFPDMPGVNG